MSTLSDTRETLEGSRYKEVPSHVRDSLGGEPRLPLRQEQNVDQQQSPGERDPRGGDRSAEAPAVLRAILLPARPARGWRPSFSFHFPPDGQPCVFIHDDCPPVHRP